MKKSFSFIFVSALLLTLASPLHAEESSAAVRTTGTVTKTETNERIKNARLEKLAEFEKRMESRQEELKKRLEGRRETLKEKLDAFKDKRKATIASRVSENLQKINTNKINAMKRQIEQMENLLAKVSDRTQSAKNEGKDVSKIEIAIAGAQSAIDAAKAALVVQAGKDYTLNVSGESKVREDAQKDRDQLKSDLKSVHEKVMDARKALANTISIIYTTLGKQKTDNMTITVSPTKVPTITP